VEAGSNFKKIKIKSSTILRENVGGKGKCVGNGPVSKRLYAWGEERN